MKVIRMKKMKKEGSFLNNETKSESMIFESAREAKLAIICIGFLGNHRLCTHSYNQLVRVYQCLFTTFQIIFL